MIFITIAVFILILGVLIFVHEFGHFIAARKMGVKVEEFGFGYPPRIIGFYKDKNGKYIKVAGNKEIKNVPKTLYSLNWLPLGGFCKIKGEDRNGVKDKNSFAGKKIWQRALILSAGVIMNLLLSIILFSIGFNFGFPQAIENEIPKGAKDIGIQIIDVSKDSPAALAGIKLGDKIIEIQNSESKTKKEIKEVEDIQNFTKDNLEKEIIITIQRGNKILKKEIVPRENPPEGEGAMGVALIKTARIAYPLHESILKGTENTFWMIGATFDIFSQVIKGAITGKDAPKTEIAGPIGIGGLVSQMIDLGWIYVLQFTAVLSLNLAILNILPFPALDGGRMIFLFIEKIKKSPVRVEIENSVNQIGFILLILLMIIVTFNDVKKLF